MLPNNHNDNSQANIQNLEPSTDDNQAYIERMKENLRYDFNNLAPGLQRECIINYLERLYTENFESYQRAIRSLYPFIIVIPALAEEEDLLSPYPTTNHSSNSEDPFAFMDTQEDIVLGENSPSQFSEYEHS